MAKKKSKKKKSKKDKSGSFQEKFVAPLLLIATLLVSFLIWFFGQR